MFPQVPPQQQVPPALHKAFPAVTHDLRSVLGSFPTTGEGPGGWEFKGRRVPRKYRRRNSQKIVTTWLNLQCPMTSQGLGFRWSL